jgi:hypothetical protein
MSVPGLPFPHWVSGALGAASSTPIPVGGIRVGNKVLAAIQHNASAGTVTGLNPASFTVSDGSVATTVNTTGSFLSLIWTEHP